MMTKDVKMPDRIAALPRDEKDRPVPFFVTWVDGKPDFRIVSAQQVLVCYHTKVCFICGQPLGKYLAFVLGPMSTVSEISAEPPSHYECAVYAVQVCPFLATPQMHRRDANMPEGVQNPAERFMEHNPGVSAVWVCRDYKPFVKDHGILVALGEPQRVEWYKEGRRATRAEVAAGFEYGAEKFYELAEDEEAFFVGKFEKAFMRAKERWPE